MKAINVVKAHAVLVGLGLTVLLAVPSQAQQEVDPDHFEATEVDSAPQAQKLLSQQQNAADLRGNFTLPFEVQCEGKVLTPGHYSLSVDSAGPNRLITIRGKNGVMTIRPRAISRHNSAGARMLLVKREGQRRTVEAIYLEKLGLYLETNGQVRLARNREWRERIPIS